MKICLQLVKRKFCLLCNVRMSHYGQYNNNETNNNNNDKTGSNQYCLFGYSKPLSAHIRN